MSSNYQIFPFENSLVGLLKTYQILRTNAGWLCRLWLVGEGSSGCRFKHIYVRVFTNEAYDVKMR
jgi:hypothetical protein